MKTNELRQKYLDFFVSKGHSLQPSDVLVPAWDPTVLFTPAGMNQFKDHFLGKVDLEFTRATTCQKCLRTGDIDNVGRTAYHHTFFEMLGNFSFGDYFKREAINWAWEFLTEKKWLGIDADRLAVTVYLDDDEAADIWQQDIGLPVKRIQRLDEYENFWPAGAPSDGPDGVCGPCSEIFFYPDSGKEVEIWNLVFTQFNREGTPPDNLSPLPSKNIDTGMGLERIAAVMQGHETNYHIDTLRPLVEAVGEVVGVKYVPEDDNGRRLRRIADHVRACTFAIHENTLPDSNAENYVIRKLLRRATLDGSQMGLRDPFLYQLVGKVAEVMSEPYPELAETVQRVQDVVKGEETGFLNIIESGKRRVEPLLKKLKADGSKSVPGEQVAELHQTYGVPPEMVEALALEEDLAFDWDGYRAAMKKHGDVSGGGDKGVMGNFGPIDEIKKEIKSTEFVGYESVTAEAVIRGIADQDTKLESLNGESSDQAIVVLDSSPFYAESGGQVGDTGTIKSETGEFSVTDTLKDGQLFKHVGKLVSGELKVGQSVTATVADDRRDAIRRAHSATHILHHALQTTLGKHAQQQGSKVEPDVLRFDFSNASAVKYEDLVKIENISNEKVVEGSPIKAEVIPMKQAKEAGAMMLFGEKYPDPVRMVSMGEFSKELCGGTHLDNTSEVGFVEITTEEAVAAGTRRVVACTGKKAAVYRKQVETECDSLAKNLGTEPANVQEAVEQLVGRVRALKKQLSSGKVADEAKSLAKSTVELSYQEKRTALRESARLMNCPLFETATRATGLVEETQSLEDQIKQLADAGDVSADGLLESAEQVEGVTVIVCDLPGGNPNLMRRTIDQIRQKQSPVAIFFGAAMGDDKVTLVAGISRELVEKGVKAGDWVKRIAPIVGGGGGGQPDLAQAGGKIPAKLPEALEEARVAIKEMLSS